MNDAAVTQLKYDVDAVAPLAAAIESSIYAQQNMAGRPRFQNRLELLTYALSNTSLEGLLLEFGVNDGTTLNHIAGVMAAKRVIGFDSFEGLPEAWVDVPVGHFAQIAPPKVRANVELVIGRFDRSLPSFVDGLTSKDVVSFLHIDCDLYASTQTVLTQLRGRIVRGTIIVFDEYFNYPQWRRHEYLAFQEFIQYSGLKYEYIGVVPRYEHVAVKIL